MEKAEGDTEMLKCNSVINSEICRCSELEERSEKAEARCAELELDLQKKKKDYEVLEAKFNAMEEEKIAIENMLKFMRISSEGLQGNQVNSEREKEKKTEVDLEEANEGEDKVLQLLIEIKVLEYEKKKAESEVQVWEERFKKLESWALELGLDWASLDCHEENGMKQDNVWLKPEGNSHLGTSLNMLQNQGKVVDLANVASSCIFPSAARTSSSDMYWRSPLHSRAQPGRRVRKQLAFESEKNPGKKIVPSTPVGAKSGSDGVIDIIDSDDEPNITQQPMPHNQGSGSIFFSTCFTSGTRKMSENKLNGSFYKEEDLNFGDVPFIATPKRKRTCNIVTSESESDDDNDNMPISRLKRMHIQEVSPDQVRCDLNNSVTAAPSADDKVTGTVTPRRRLVPLRKCKSQEDKNSSCGPSEAKQQRSIPTNENADDDELEEVLSSSEEESMSNFIVNDSDVSDCEDTSSKSLGASDGEVDSDSQDASDGDVNFSKILSRIQRNKDQKMKWEFEAEMLAAFGKDPELCMKAVCTLYRQQTLEEQISKGSLYYNGRGFSKFDALRGSTLAEFLSDGDPLGDLKKSVQELQEYDPKGVEHCRTMAIRYSKQLFEIYKNKEDPLFP
ncbi:protein IWS1-like protein [Senna tora]|uniref:Protein IWS1-like protein n=1 Tax=Senna tora TaxID=362788 RepID=A0A834TZZ4_9FABA|nr:protein IWS1-like protein [Senna tora]